MKLSKKNILNLLINYKYIILIFLIIISIYIYFLNIEGFKAPKFKDEIEEDFDNPLLKFGYKYKKSEKFNSGNKDDKIQNALDEVDRLDVNSISFGNMKNILHQYNNNITKQLKKIEKYENSNLQTAISQTKLFYNEFKKLFDLDLII